MKNNKGMTIIEIIVSIALISIILVFLINLLITVKNSNDKNKSASELLINQALITKTIQNDFEDLRLNGIYVCTQEDVTANAPNSIGEPYCLKFKYETGETGYLLMYKIQYSSDEQKTIVGYKRGTNQVMRETTNISTANGTVTTSCKNGKNSYTKCSVNITLPIMGNDTNNYDINLNYIYSRTGSVNNKFLNNNTNGNAYKFKITYK